MLCSAAHTSGISYQTSDFVARAAAVFLSLLRVLPCCLFRTAESERKKGVQLLLTRTPQQLEVDNRVSGGCIW